MIPAQELNESKAFCEEVGEADVRAKVPSTGAAESISKVDVVASETLSAPSSTRSLSIAELVLSAGTAQL